MAASGRAGPHSGGGGLDRRRRWGRPPPRFDCPAECGSGSAEEGKAATAIEAVAPVREREGERQWAGQADEEGEEEGEEEAEKRPIERERERRRRCTVS